MCCLAPPSRWFGQSLQLILTKLAELHEGIFRKAGEEREIVALQQQYRVNAGMFFVIHPRLTSRRSKYSRHHRCPRCFVLAQEIFSSNETTSYPLFSLSNIHCTWPYVIRAKSILTIIEMDGTKDDQLNQVAFALFLLPPENRKMLHELLKYLHDVRSTKQQRTHSAQAVRIPRNH